MTRTVFRPTGQADTETNATLTNTHHDDGRRKDPDYWLFTAWCMS